MPSRRSTCCSKAAIRRRVSFLPRPASTKRRVSEVSINVQLPELPDAKMLMRRLMRFPQIGSRLSLKEKSAAPPNHRKGCTRESICSCRFGVIFPLRLNAFAGKTIKHSGKEAIGPWFVEIDRAGRRGGAERVPAARCARTGQVTEFPISPCRILLFAARRAHSIILGARPMTFLVFCVSCTRSRGNPGGAKSFGPLLGKAHRS